MQTTNDPTPDSGGSSSSLDAQETSHPRFDEEEPSPAGPLDLQSTHQRIAHRRHEGTRRRIIMALHHHGDAGLGKRAHRLAACCCCPTFRTGGSQRIGVNLARCRDRLCPLCSHRRGLQATAKVLALTHEFDSPRLLTLTLKSNDQPLRDVVFRLFNRFAQLRQLDGWSSRVTGGVWTLEVTRNPTTAQWHPHLHIIIDGEFFPHALLKKLWLAVTGDSFVVDIRAIHDRREAAKYVAGYIAKPADVAAWPASAIAEYALALHGRRLMQPFGTARKVDLDDDADDEKFSGGSLLCTAHTLHAACSAGHEPALHAREILARLSIDHAIASGVTPPTSSGTAAPVEDWELTLAETTLRRLQEHWPNLPNDTPAVAPEPKRERTKAAPLLYEGQGQGESPTYR